MCGLTALYNYAAPAPPDHPALLRTRDPMAARGPDGAGLWCDLERGVGLAYRRLAVIDPSDAGAQPMASADGRLHVSFNGEIYNHRALRRELEKEGHRFRSRSDTEILLQLYAARGEAMLGDLRGMYAVAIWDARRRGLFLARGAYGIKVGKIGVPGLEFLCLSYA